MNALQKLGVATVLGSAILGGIGFIGGFFGPLIFMDSNAGPLIGIFITGPLGFLLGAPIGFLGGLVFQERNGGNVPVVTYTRGRDLSGTFQGAGGVGGLLARTDNSVLATLPLAAHAYYHADGNGNITCLINSSNAVMARYLYDPFGRILSQSGALAAANLYRFSSKEFHVNSGMYYYLYRFYDPSLQRWINRDPKDEMGFDLSRLRRNWSRDPDAGGFVFARNDPVNSYDLLGLDT